MPQLRVLLGYQQGLLVALNGASVTIGRDPRSNLILHPDSPASRCHAEVIRVGDDWRIRDLGSVNGTLLNGVRVKEEVLRGDDEVIIGDNVLIFEEATPEAADLGAAASLEALGGSSGVRNRQETQILVEQFSTAGRRLREELAPFIPAEVPLVQSLLTAVLAEGHVYVRGLTGLTAGAVLRAFADLFRLKFRRASPAANLTVTEIAGFEVASVPSASQAQESSVQPGAMFTNVLLMEDLARASEGIHSVLLDAIREGSVCLSGKKHPIEPPFLVVATDDLASALNNSAISLRDAFMMHLQVTSKSLTGNSLAQAFALAQSGLSASPLSARHILRLRQAARDLPMSEELVREIVQLVRSIRAGDSVVGSLQPAVRASRAGKLAIAAKAHALVSGRLRVLLEDIAAVAPSVLPPSPIPVGDAKSEGLSMRDTLSGGRDPL
jgi:MoxR-like ATPase